MKPARIFVTLVVLAAVAALTATCVATTPSSTAPTQSPATPPTAAPTKPPATPPTAVPTKPTPTKSPAGQQGITPLPAPVFTCTVQGAGTSTQRTCISAELTDPTKTVKVIIRGSQAQVLTVQGRPVDSSTTLDVLLTKGQDNFRPNPARVITNFEIVDQEKKQSVNKFDPALEVWVEYSDADVKFADGKDVIRMAFPDEGGQKWLVFGAKSGQKAVVEGNYIYVSGISSWSDPPIVAGDCGIMKYKEPDGKYNCKQ